MAVLSKPVEAPGLDRTGTNGSSIRASWNDDQKEYLLQQLVNFPRARRGGWSNETWLKIAEDMEQEFPWSNFTTQQLKQQQQDLQKVYKKVREILMRPGFKWDNKNCMLQASNDSWRQLSARTNAGLSWCGRTIRYFAPLVALNKDELPLPPSTGFCAQLSSPKADELGVPSGPSFFTSDQFLLNNSPDLDFDTSLFISYPIPQETHNYNSTAPSDLSDASNQLIHATITDEAAGFPHSMSIANPCNQMPYQFPAQEPNLQLFSNLASNQPQLEIVSSPSPTIDDNEMANNQILSSPPRQKLSSYCPSNNDTATRGDLTLSAPLNPDRVSNSQQPGKQNKFSNNPEQNSLRKLATKSDFSISRCIRIFNKLPGFEKRDIKYIVEIFKDELHRQAFIPMKKSHKVHWLRGMIVEEESKNKVKKRIKKK